MYVRSVDVSVGLCVLSFSVQVYLSSLHPSNCIRLLSTHRILPVLSVCTSNIICALSAHRILPVLSPPVLILPVLSPSVQLYPCSLRPSNSTFPISTRSILTVLCPSVQLYPPSLRPSNSNRTLYVRPILNHRLSVRPIPSVLCLSVQF